VRHRVKVNIGDDPMKTYSGEAAMLSDHDIITRVQRGERELFGELHTRYHERIYRTIGRSIFDPDTAQDIAGEVWVRAYAAVDRFSPRESHSVVAWLLRIAANLVTDHRRRLPVGETCDDYEEKTLRLVAPAAEREVLRMEQSRAVRRALETLSEGDRQIIHLAHDNDLSCREIAVVLDKPSVSAVTSHLHRAMRHLKTALEQSGWFSEHSDNADKRAAR